MNMVRIVWFLLLICPHFLLGQTNEGQLFWCGFMEHRDIGEDNMVVMITSKQNTSGVVRIPLKNWQMSFQVAANAVTLVNLPTLAEFTGSEIIKGLGISIESQAPVSVYIHQYHSMRSEATVVLPVESLGTEHYILTYRGISSQGTEYPSEFLVVAGENGTQLKIYLSDQTKGGKQAGDSLLVTLQAGESYQVQGKYGSNDLTGTYVKSNKKCSVFAGARWTEVPTGCSARDNLLEQMYPVNTWGKQFVTVPNAQVINDVFRIIAKQDQTTVQVQGISTQNYTLNAGEFVEYARTEPTYIVANHAIAVAQFCIGSGCNGYTIGDPAMVMLNSIEQILDTVTLYNSSFENITENYINVITRTLDTATVLFNNQPLNGFIPIGANPQYAYRRIAVQPGPSTLISGGCGLIATAYGYGNVESYAYSGGASFKSLDTNPLPDGSCLNDTIRFDAGLKPPRYALQWDMGDGQTSAATAFDYVYQALGDYPVRLLVYDNCLNTTDTLDKILRVTLRQALDLNPTIERCAGEIVTLSATDLPGAAYEWHGPNYFYSTSQYPQFVASGPDESGGYSAIGIVSGCATFPAYTALTVFPLPTPALGPDSFFCRRLSDDRIVLEVGNYAAYHWFDGRVSATHVVNEAGWYWVAVQDSNGCVAADSVYYEEICPTRVYIPNAFSPNDDGWNDSFGIDGLEILSLRLQVFDRWGGLVYETQEVSGRWDGTQRGKESPSGVYIWVLQLSGQEADGTQYEDVLSGDVTLIR